MGTAGFESIESTDMELARLTRGAAAWRLGLGMGLEALARIGGHRELGFSSLEGYALERCERATRWVQESRGLARRLETLPLVRRALISGKLGWSLALIIAKVASAEDEAAWLRDAETLTVRAMADRVRARGAAQRAEISDRATPDTDATETRDEPFRTLTVTVDREDAWLFECARTLVKHEGGLTHDDVVDALVGEGLGTLRERIPRERMIAALELTTDGADKADAARAAQRGWAAQLDEWRSEAERRCEPRIQAGSAIAPPADAVEQATFALDFDAEQAKVTFDFAGIADANVIDHHLCRISSELAQRDLTIGRLAEAFWKADGWRRLGYATETQYTRERLRVSTSSIEAKRQLARRVAAMPRLSDALTRRALGYEAARLVAGVASPDTVDAWIARASERTVRHLREEVDAAEMLARFASDLPRPPSQETMNAVAAFESAVVSGAAFAEPGAGSRASPPSQGTGNAVAAFENAGANSAAFAKPSGGPAPSAAVAQMYAPGARDPNTRKLGRVTLRLRVRESTYASYRWFEDLLVRSGAGGPTCLRFLCESLMDSWKHALGKPVAYGSVYARDRYRCTNPVCSSRAITPHHIVFRSHGGDDTDDNVTSLCVACHLEGVHGGCLRARGAASAIEWTLGRHPHTVVRGRQRGRCLDEGARAQS
jgi:HNH endonuclease